MPDLSVVCIVVDIPPNQLELTSLSTLPLPTIYVVPSFTFSGQLGTSAICSACLEALPHMWETVLVSISLVTIRVPPRIHRTLCCSDYIVPVSGDQSIRCDVQRSHDLDGEANLKPHPWPHHDNPIMLFIVLFLLFHHHGDPLPLGWTRRTRYGCTNDDCSVGDIKFSGRHRRDQIKNMLYHAGWTGPPQ